MWYIHNMGCYLASKRKEIWTRATARMKLGDSMLSEISQPQRNQLCRIPRTGKAWNSHIRRVREWNSGFPGLGWEKVGGRYVVGMEFKLRMMKTFWGQMVRMVAG